MSQFNPQNHSFQEMSTCFRRKLTVWPGGKLLKRHALVYFEKKAKRCLNCELSFKSNNQLKIHERIHSNLKPYQCEVCNKSYSQQGDLKEHEKVHSGEWQNAERHLPSAVIGTLT